VDANHNTAETRILSIGAIMDSTPSDAPNPFYTVTTTSGNVGIGLSTSNASLIFSDSNSDNFFIYDSSGISLSTTIIGGVPIPAEGFVYHVGDASLIFQSGIRPNDALTFSLSDKEILRIDKSGNIFIKGNMAISDKEICDALVAFLRGVGAINRPLTPQQNIILHDDPMIGGLSRFDIALGKDSTANV
jgi:hypothetical protein